MTSAGAMRKTPFVMAPSLKPTRALGRSGAGRFLLRPTPPLHARFSGGGRWWSAYDEFWEISKIGGLLQHMSFTNPTESASGSRQVPHAALQKHGQRRQATGDAQSGYACDCFGMQPKYMFATSTSGSALGRGEIHQTSKDVRPHEVWEDYWPHPEPTLLERHYTRRGGNTYIEAEQDEYPDNDRWNPHLDHGGLRTSLSQVITTLHANQWSFDWTPHQYFFGYRWLLHYIALGVVMMVLCHKPRAMTKNHRSWKMHYSRPGCKIGEHTYQARYSGQPYDLRISINDRTPDISRYNILGPADMALMRDYSTTVGIDKMAGGGVPTSWASATQDHRPEGESRRVYNPASLGYHYQPPQPGVAR